MHSADDEVVLDTDVASLGFKGRLPGPTATALVGHTLCVTFVTVAEMARWADKRQWGTRRRTELVDWLARRAVLPYAAEVSWRWGALVAAAERRGRPRPVNDTWIAACCLVAELPLATLNTKDFADFADHDGLRLFAAGSAD